ncbi:MAG: uroporphyrinogen decarboxylase family protein [Lachnospiraceae bacterium]
MLTPKQNVLECIKGGNPDRFVSQYEFMKLFRSDPFTVSNTAPKPGELNVVNAWGVTRSWPKGTPGVFPVHDAEHIVIKDICEWQKYVKAPNVKFSDTEWEKAIADYESVDRDKYFVGPSIHPGLFEQCHYLMEIQNCLISFYEEPDAMHDLIKYLTDWEIQYADELCSHVHPSVCFHHDDWGTQISTFLSPDMFAEFYLDAYKEIYGYYRSRGVELIVHHSDSYAETLVPYMIEMGVDIWQGVMTTNDIKGCIQKYGGQISFMGGIDSAKVDFPEWTEDIVKAEVRKACETYGNGGKYFIPCCSQGGPMSTFPGVYDLVSQEIDNISKEMF